MGSMINDAYCRHCRELIHFTDGLWYHGARRRECNPMSRTICRIATPSHQMMGRKRP